MSKLDAIYEAKGIAKKFGFGYVISYNGFDCIAARNKPNLRPLNPGFVIEIDSDGIQYPG